MRTAVILRVLSGTQRQGLRTWFEFAPLVNGRPRRRPDHMMASAESAARRARAHGFEIDDAIIDYRLR